MTAEKFLKQSKSLHDMWDNTRGRGEWDEKAIINSHIEFAKLHVKKALKARDRLYQTHFDELTTFWTEENKKFIQNSYPLENIK